MRVAGHTSQLIPLLLRLYEEVDPESEIQLVNTCLDAWDRLLENRLALAYQLTRALEAG